MPIKFLSRPTIFFFAILSILALFLPLNFIILEPGPTSNLLSAKLTILGQKLNTFDKGALYSTTVYVTSPGERPNGLNVLSAWIDGDRAVLPTAALYRRGEKPQDATDREVKAMAISKVDAGLAAKKFLNENSQYPMPTWHGADVQIDMKKVGGSSAGLAFALAIIAKSADADLIKGRKIAVTGTISGSGAVGAIGGVDQKILGAKKSGAEIFIAPRVNCPEISKHPKGISILVVRNLAEAVRALKNPLHLPQPEIERVFACPRK